MLELCQNYKYQIYNNIITINISLSKYILQQDVNIFYKLWFVTVSEAGSQSGRPRQRETSSSNPLRSNGEITEETTEWTTSSTKSIN